MEPSVTKRGVFTDPHVDIELMAERRIAGLNTATVNVTEGEPKTTEPRVSYVN
jgi:hypothetical protein